MKNQELILRIPSDAAKIIAPRKHIRMQVILITQFVLTATVAALHADRLIDVLLAQQEPQWEQM